MAKKLTGDLAETSVGTNVSFTATTASTSPTLSAVSSTTGLVVGQVLSGTGIPSGTTISAIGSGTLTMSANATASGTGTVIAAAELQVLGLMEWSIDFKRKTADATTTDDSAWESSLGSSRSWTAKAKFCYLFGDTSQATAVRAAITAAQAPQQWNFFADPDTGDDDYTGLAYIDGITITSGVGKVVGMDVSLKGTGPLNIGTQTAPVSNPNTITGEQAEA